MPLIKYIAHHLYLMWFKYKFPNTKIICNYFSDTNKGFFSQQGQDSFIYSEFFSQIENGIIPHNIVDIGCNHPTKYSNSYFFEKYVGFDCVAIDPLMTYAIDWRQLRPRAKLHTTALSDTNGFIELHVPEAHQHKPLQTTDHAQDMFSTITTSNSRLASGNWSRVKVPMRTGKEIFRENNLTAIGILSIDVEGHELNVLKGIDFSNVRIFIIVIENNSNSKFGSNDIRTFMQKKNFAFYARIWGLDDIYIRDELLENKI